MTMGEIIENAIRKIVDFCHNPTTSCSKCPFQENNGCSVSMAVLEDLIHFTDKEILPRGEKIDMK